MSLSKAKIDQGINRSTSGPAKRFFQLAATLAKPSPDERSPPALNRANESAIELTISDLLEPGYQERSKIYQADQARLARTKIDHCRIDSAIKKISQAFGLKQDDISKDALLATRPRGNSRLLFEDPKSSIDHEQVSFGKEDVTALLNLIAPSIYQLLLASHEASAIDGKDAIFFHNALSSLISRDEYSPLNLIDEKNKIFLAAKLRIFCSNRLKLKSLQTKSGAKPEFRYYHVAFLARSSAKEQKNILYWLKNDDSGAVIDGDFIALKGLLRPKILFCSRQEVARMADHSPQGFIPAVLKIYLSSLSS